MGACSTSSVPPRATAYCDEVRGTCAEAALQLTELSTHLQGQLVAVHPAYDVSLRRLRAARGARQPGGAAGMGGRAAAQAGGKGVAQSRPDGARDVLRRARLAVHVSRGRSARPGWSKTAFDELARRWRPILDAFDDAGVDVCYEMHPGEDLHDGVSFEMFLDRVGNHPRANLLYDPSHFVLQQLDYLEYIDIYHERIRMFHVKDAEFHPNGRKGVYGGYQSWVNRAGRFRSLGDGQVDFSAIFSKLTQYGFRRLGGAGVGVLHQGQRAGRGRGRAVHRARTSSRSAKRAFDDFAASGVDHATNRRMLGLG